MSRTRRASRDPAEAHPSTVAATACTIRGRVTGEWARGAAARVSGSESDEALARLATRSKGG